jgi:5-formyltetrahydrofolate cyclo-ligase
MGLLWYKRNIYKVRLEMQSVIEKKSLLRQQMLLKRRTYVENLTAEDKLKASLRVSDQLFAFLSLQSLVIACYIPFWDELDPQPLMHAYLEVGCKIALPVVDEDHSLTFRQWAPETPLIKSSFGIMVPSENSPSLDPEVFLIPLVAFDPSGHRLGYGRGHYDRALKTLRATKNIIAIGLAYDMQRVGLIPPESTDQRLDGIITEKQIYQVTIL